MTYPLGVTPPAPPGLQGPAASQVFAPFDPSVLAFPVNVQSADTAVSGQLVTGQGIIIFASWRNHATTAVSQFSLYDGTDTSGQRLLTMNIPAGAGDTTSPGFPGIPFRRGIYLEVRAGSFVLTCTYIPMSSMP